MIYLVSESEVEKTYEMFYGENALFDFRTEKYLSRIVTSPNQLVEKIQIFDAGKDDRIMELVKLLATDSLLENNPDEEFDELRFAVDDDGTNILVIINKGETTGAVDIDNMYEFADKFFNIALPRVRDFKGVSKNSFDGRGNYSMGIKEQLIFPEINYDKVDTIKGMNIVFTTTAKTDEEAAALLELLGMPFEK